MADIHPRSPTIPDPPKTNENQTKSKILGIDVSHYEPSVDWEKAKAGGVVYMYAKATEGVSHVDVMFKKHIEAAIAAGVKVGAYHFFHADMDGEAQAENYLKAIAGMKFDLPHCLDWESSSGDGRDQAQKWLDIIEKQTGSVPALYSGEAHFRELKLPQSFSRYPLWMAHYGVPEAKLRIPNPWTKLFGWQYTDSEGSPRVQGLPLGHHVDASWFYV
jgi:lysozyme